MKAAIMVEDAARSMYLALLLGQPWQMPSREVERAHQRSLREHGGF